MINSIKIENFKSIKNYKFKLNNLTVLTGLNSSGKSSLIQAIRMVNKFNQTNDCLLPSHGGFTELLSKNTDHHSFIFSLEIENKLYVLTNTKENSDLNTPLPNLFIEYISAERLGPRSNLPTLHSNWTNIGERGEHLADYAILFEESTIHKEIRHPHNDSKLLKHQLQSWMQEISPGVNLEFESNVKHDSSFLEVDNFRATNSGFGISYSLPIMLAILNLTSPENNISTNHTVQKWFENKINPILLIENPEAHLHPMGQTILGRLCARASKCGLQVIVETHSDHFIDGVRLEAKHNNDLDSGIYYFSKNENLETKIERIEINNDGSLSKWPKGFFDQISLNLRELSK